MKKIAKVLLWVVGIVLVLTVSVSLAAGPIAKNYVNRHGEELTGRRLQVDRVGLNLLTGNVKLQGLEVYEEDGTTVFAGFDTLSIQVHLLQLPFKTVNLRHITLAGLHANVLQDGNRFNFSSLIDHFKSDKEKDEKEEKSSWSMKFYNIRISHAQLRYRDLRGNKELNLPDVNLKVPGFVLGGSEQTEGGLNLTFDKGGRLNADTHYQGDQGQFDAAVTLDDFSLRNVEGYIKDFVDLRRVAGTLNAKVKLNGQTSALMKSHVAADLNLADVALHDAEGQVAGIEALTVKVNDINLDRNSFDIAELHLDGLTATYEQWEGQNTLGRLLKKKKSNQAEEEEAPADSTAAPKAKKERMKLHVGNLLVENCAVTYVNHTLPEEFRFPVTGLTVNASDLNMEGDNAARLRATLPGGGLLAVRWQGNIDDWKRSQELFLTVKGLDMKQLTPWTLAYIGQPIEEGIFSLTSRNSISESNLNGQNSLDIYKMTLGKRRKEVDAKLNLPVNAALYILKDKDEKIQIDLPVKGNVDNPEFSYMKVVWKTLGNLIVKVATSPARALGNAMGLGDDELEFIAVDPEQRSLTSEQYHTLGQLATIAKSDSLLVLVLERHMPEPQNDSVAHRHGMIDRQVLRYLEEQGVPQGRVRITDGEAPDKSGKCGYAVSSEMKLD